jgi:hypothetical protein
MSGMTYVVPGSGLVGGSDTALTEIDNIVSGITPLGGATVTATGSTTARTLATRAADYVNVLDYGAKGDGTTDDTAAFQAAIDAAVAAGGGTIQIPTATFRLNGQLTVGYTGTPPKQKPIRFIGAGAYMDGHAGSPPNVTANGATVLDWRYSGTYGKFLTVAAGLVEWQGVTFTDGAGTSTPWIYTTARPPSTSTPVRSSDRRPRRPATRTASSSAAPSRASGPPTRLTGSRATGR